MPISRYVEQGVVFRPEVLSVMSKAFTAAIETLGIGNDEIKRQAVAKFIIQLARKDGDLDAAALRDRAVAAFGGPIHAAYQPDLGASLSGVRPALGRPDSLQPRMLGFPATRPSSA